jgi:hypothetical protein
MGALPWSIDSTEPQLFKYDGSRKEVADTRRSAPPGTLPKVTMTAPLATWLGSAYPTQRLLKAFAFFGSSWIANRRFWGGVED